ncbi:3-deoxy-D-manno-octulosonic acid transferase [Skermanella stibiiresistens SB22]|uniref:3-deoxy-D-manno-octulosonic acid transferase n=1 Tax=Skermanella stibiiresistens SB22 TaxID=1385369 RepID=W9H2E3_9PROT|nr:3-deoxy-D-manno-octulosonic acid transferase [Skermanella stibiiresistens]EWY40355.1 3-deoxy-D-manno-octulosonic acid transferase [Skermanella stibiiresistens SB22]
MLQTIYRGLTEIGGPAIRLYLARRRSAGKEDPVRGAERLGIASVERPAGRLAWFHAASVGESMSVLVLINRLLDTHPNLTVLITTGTVTSAELMARRLPERAIHQYVPVDRMRYVRAFLDHWRPDLALWIESEIWPNMLSEIGRRGIPAALVNARMSAGSFRNWLRVPGFIRPLLSTFSLCLAQTEVEVDRLRRLGARDVRCVGNLKFSAEPLPADPAELAVLRGAFGDRPLWLMASSHPGEEDIAADVHAALRDRLPGLLTVIVPRHPQRGGEVSDMLARRGLPVARRSTGTLPGPGHEVYLADTVGELGLFFRLAEVVCVGGSLVPIGGHNPVEPAQLGCAVIHGPHMTNFSEVSAQLEAAGAAITVRDGAELVREVGGLLSDEPARTRLAEAASAVAERNRRVVDAVVEALAPALTAAGIQPCP